MRDGEYPLKQDAIKIGDTSMENKQTLANVLNKPETTNTQTQDTTSFYNAYLNIVSSQLYYRFPVINDLSSINQFDIQSICRFSFAITPTVIDTWRENYESLNAEGYRTWIKQQQQRRSAG
jgi:hypothetical protein